MKTIIVVASLILFSVPITLSGQRLGDTIPKFDELILRQRLIKDNVPLDEFNGIVKYKRKEYENRKRGIIENVIRENFRFSGPQGCVNEDFENGNFNGWNGFTGCNPIYSGCAGNCCPNTGIISGRHTIESSGVDPIGNFPKVFPGGNHSVRLGNSSTGGEAESLTKSFFVNNTNKIFSYHYAVVLNDPNHDKSHQPYFEIVMFDKNRDTVPCSLYKVVSGQGIPGFKSNGTWVYKEWSSNVVDLTNYIGQTVTIQFSTFDCGWGGHAGYAYLDASCFQDEMSILDEPCANEELTFTSTSTNIYDNEVLSWNFGDGSPTSNLSSPSHIYTSPGIYTVTLSISYPDNPGCGRTFSKSFSITTCDPCINFNSEDTTVVVHNDSPVYKSMLDNWQTKCADLQYSNENSINGFADIYLKAYDEGCTQTSWLINNVDYKGNWLDFKNCLCFDFRIFNDGGASNTARSLYIYSGSNDPVSAPYRAVFRQVNPISKSDGWVNICVPAEKSNNWLLPSNEHGYWDMTGPTGGGAADWDFLISNVTGIAFRIDLTSDPSEVYGYDNICFKSCPKEKCKDCPTSFAPIPGKKYVLSAWVKEANGLGKTTFSGPAIKLDFIPISSTSSIRASGKIIDGWQLIEKEFTVPIGTEEIAVKLLNTGIEEIFVDDIRIHPFSASMKTFVYDPVSLRLMAELDERNYATYYEHDEEGRLIRMKKETSRGIQTIQQSFNSTQKIKSN